MGRAELDDVALALDEVADVVDPTEDGALVEFLGVAIGVDPADAQEFAVAD